MPQRLLFISPRPLFPADSGGKIRTGQILRGLKGGAFEITLASPFQPGEASADLEKVCDRFVAWPAKGEGAMRRWLRPWLLLSRLPVSVAADSSPAATATIAALMAEKPDVTVFDFAHSAVLKPRDRPGAAVMFTHNVEAEIFRRQRDLARNPVLRAVWAAQYRKMTRFERRALNAFDTVIAVSQRDARWFREEYAVPRAEVIPTGTDLDYFGYREPPRTPEVVFTGSMDWSPNVDAARFLLNEVWPRIRAGRPDARMTIVGRSPPPSLRQEVSAKGAGWTLTGSVPDIRPYVHDAAVYVIPLRIGGGTRIKAFEAMALGCPVVSTTLGVEGLGLTPGDQYLNADSSAELADAVLRLMADRDLQLALTRSARAHVEAHASSRRVAKRFEEICLAASGCAAADRSKSA